MHVIATAGYFLRSLYHVPRLLPAPALTLDTSCSDISCYQYLSNLPLLVASLKRKAPGIKCDDTAGATRIVQRENAFTGERTYAGRVGSRYCAVKVPASQTREVPWGGGGSWYPVDITLLLNPRDENIASNCTLSFSTSNYQFQQNTAMQAYTQIRYPTSTS